GRLLCSWCWPVVGRRVVSLCFACIGLTSCAGAEMIDAMGIGDGRVKEEMWIEQSEDVLCEVASLRSRRDGRRGRRGVLAPFVATEEMAERDFDLPCRVDRTVILCLANGCETF